MPGRLLADHAGAQHQPVGDDFRLLGVFLENGHEITGQTHDGFQSSWDSRSQAESTAIVDIGSVHNRFAAGKKPA